MCSHCHENEVKEGHLVQQYKSRRKVEWKPVNTREISPVGGGQGSEGRANETGNATCGRSRK